MVIQNPNMQHRGADTSSASYALVKAATPLLVVVPLFFGTTASDSLLWTNSNQQTPSSRNSFVLSEEVTDHAIIQAVEDLTSKLAAQQMELTSSAAKVLLKNRWDWYE